MACAEFHTINLRTHATTCVAFRRDSFVCSFGSDKAFVAESGADGGAYLTWLAARIEMFPDGHVHVWRDSAIIGQLEMAPLARDHSIGYVNLFYLAAEARGVGLGDALHEHAVKTLTRHGATTLQLSVSDTNARARRYYEKHGWSVVCARKDNPNVHVMELALPRLTTTPTKS